METLWESNRKHNFDCYVDGIHRVNVAFAGGGAVITTPDGEFHIRRKGFWRPRIAITDRNGIETTLVSSRSWRSNALLEWKGETYEFRMRNNPLAEGSFWKEGNPILSYGLGFVKRKPAVRVTRTAAVDPVLDGILFYMMRAIFQEQGACDVSASVILMMSV